MSKALDLLLEYRQDGSKNWAIRFIKMAWSSNTAILK